jgi:predicted CoA-binding protein
MNSDAEIRKILTESRVIAIIGASPSPERDSQDVMRYLQERGYRAIPVNPHVAGQEILGEKVYASLAQIPEPIDIVDIFRNPDAASEAVDQAIEVGAKAVWMQLGVINRPAAERAEREGLSVVMDRCPKIEIPRLGL